MSTDHPTTPLSTGALAQALAGAEAFALRFHDAAGEQEQPLRWVDDPALVARFAAAVRAEEVQAAYVPSKLQHEGLLRTRAGQIHRFALVDTGAEGAVLFQFDGGFAPASPELASVVAQAYALPAYSPREHSGEFRGTEEAEAPDADPERWRGVVTPPSADGSQGRPECVVIFYSDKPGTSWNRQFANKYAQLHTDRKVFVSDVASPSDAVNFLRGAYGVGWVVRQVMFAVHGTAACFDCGPYTTSVTAPTVIGLYPGNTSGRSFGDAARPYMASWGTITLLSCATAATTTYKGQTLYGRIVLTDLTMGARAWALASDKDTEIHASNATVTTNGNIWISNPDKPSPVVWRPAKPGQEMPLFAFPAPSSAEFVEFAGILDAAVAAP